MIGKPVNWRAEAVDEDPDDELLEQTPKDVIAALGFDPAKEEARQEPNAKAALSAVMRSAQLMAVGRWLVDRASDRLGMLEDELVSELVRVNPAKNKGKLDHLYVSAAKRIANAHRQIMAELKAGLQTVSKAIARRTSNALMATHGIITDVQARPADEVPILGARLADHVEKFAADTLFRFKLAVGTGVEAGDSLEKIIERVRGSSAPAVKASGDVRAAAASAAKALQVRARIMDATISSFDKMLNSAVQSAARLVEQGALENVGTERALGFEWLAVLDDRVCERCSFLDGMRWTADYQPVDGASEFPDDPPLHPNCRCTLVHVDLDGQRAGNRVLQDYFEDADEDAMQAAFGEAAVGAWKRGEIPAEALLTDSQARLSPSELAQFDDIDISGL